MISCAKLISSSKTISYKEVENIKQALINNGLPNYIVDEQIKRMIKNVNQQNKHCTTPPSQQTFIKYFTATKCTKIINQMKILRTLIHRNKLPTDSNKKIILIIYYSKFKTSNSRTIPLSRWEFCKKTMLYIIFNVFLEIVFLKITIHICRFNLNYPLEKTYNAPFCKAFKKTFMPNNRITENTYPKHNNIRISK